MKVFGVTIEKGKAYHIRNGTCEELKGDLPPPKKLSKAGEWARAHPNGLEFDYINWKAVLR